MVRSSFWNAYACALTLNGRYDQALEVADRILGEARDHDLDFIVPHAALVSAHAHLGVRQTLEAAVFWTKLTSSRWSEQTTFLP